jgi:hypothetical protein
MAAAAGDILYHARLNVLAEELRRTKESKSWKVTRPLRAISKRLGRGEG